MRKRGLKHHFLEHPTLKKKEERCAAGRALPRALAGISIMLVYTKLVDITGIVVLNVEDVGGNDKI